MPGDDSWPVPEPKKRAPGTEFATLSRGRVCVGWRESTRSTWWTNCAALSGCSSVRRLHFWLSTLRGRRPARCVHARSCLRPTPTRITYFPDCSVILFRSTTTSLRQRTAHDGATLRHRLAQPARRYRRAHVLQLLPSYRRQPHSLGYKRSDVLSAQPRRRVLRSFRAALPVVARKLHSPLPAIGDLKWEYAWGDRSPRRRGSRRSSESLATILYGLGYTGHGIGSTRVAGKILAHMALAKPSELLNLSMVRRLPFPYPPDQFAPGRSGRSPQRCVE